MKEQDNKEYTNDEWEIQHYSISDRSKSAKTIEEYIRKYGKLPDITHAIKLMSIKEIVDQFGYILTEEQIEILKDGRTEQ